MLSSKDVKSITFSRAMHGYKQLEVNAYLDEVANGLEQYERITRTLRDENERLKSEIENYRNSQSSIQSVLLQAQKLSDQMVADARAKSEEIIAEAKRSVEKFAEKERELSSAFEDKANTRKAMLEKEIEETVAKAEKKNAAIKAAADDSLKRQQILFDKLKLEVSSFKADIMKRYKVHLEALQKIPDEVPMDPKQIAEAVTANLDRVPDIESFTEENSEENNSQPVDIKSVKDSSSGFEVEETLDF